MQEIQLFNTELMKLNSKREHGDYAEIAIESGLSRITVEKYMKGGAINTRTAGKILKAARKVISNRTKALIEQP